MYSQDIAVVLASNYLAAKMGKLESVTHDYVLQTSGHVEYTAYYGN